MSGLGQCSGCLEMLTTAVIRWHQKLVTRPVVRKFLDIQAEAFKKFSQPK